METRANYLLIGAFTLAGFVGVLAFLMWFAGHEASRRYDYYEVLFPEISGISAGTQVDFSGVPLGQVVDLGLERDGRVRVRIELREGTPVRADSVATMVAQGITGLSVVSVSSGTPAAPLLADLSETAIPEIQAGRSTLESITDSAPELVEQLSEAATRLNAMLGETNQNHVSAILQNLDGATGQLEAAINDVADATGGIADVARSVETFAARFDGVAPRVEMALDDASRAARQVERVGQAVEQVEFAGISDEAKAILADLRAVLGSEDAEALPRNLSETLASAAALLDELRENDAPARLSAALASVESAADELKRTAPVTMAQVGRAADGVAAGALTFGDRNGVQAEIRQAAREIARAAAAVTSTARMIERNPNVLIRGR